MVGTSIALDQQVHPWTSGRPGPPRPGSPRRPGRAGGVPPQRGDAAGAVGAAGGHRRAANWILGFSMDFHGFKWIFIDANGFSWIQMEFDGFEWSLMDFDWFSENQNWWVFWKKCVRIWMYSNGFRNGFQGFYRISMQIFNGWWAQMVFHFQFLRMSWGNQLDWAWKDNVESINVMSIFSLTPQRMKEKQQEWEGTLKGTSPSMRPNIYKLHQISGLSSMPL